MGGFWEMSHDPSFRLGLESRLVRLIFRFMGGVGGWFLGNVPPIPPLGYD